MTKSDLRKTYKSKRRELSLQQIDELSIEIANNLLNLPIWHYSFYHVFLSIKEHQEVNTDYVLSILAGKDKNVVISKSHFSTRQMTHYLLTDGTKIQKNSWNIPEPVKGIEIESQSIDVVFVPLLAFDKKGHRVGYGKGFYDQFLSKCSSKTVKIGLSFFEAEQEIQDVSDTDISLDYCVTPQRVYEF